MKKGTRNEFETLKKEFEVVEQKPMMSMIGGISYQFDSSFDIYCQTVAYMHLNAHAIEGSNGAPYTSYSGSYSSGSSSLSSNAIGQCIIDAMLNSTTGYFQPLACTDGVWGGTYQSYVTIGGLSFTIQISLGSYNGHPNVSTIFSTGEWREHGTAFFTDGCWRYEFNNQTSNGHGAKVVIYAPAGTEGVMNQYFSTLNDR